MEKPIDLINVKDAAEYMHVTLQAIYISIKKKKICATKIGRKWWLSKIELDNFRNNKYNRDLRKIEGEYIFDLDKGHFSLNQVCKIISDGLNRPYRIQRLYYFIRIGRLKAFKKGAAWVILKKDAEELFDLEKNGLASQISFA